MTKTLRQKAMEWYINLPQEEKEAICQTHGTNPESTITGLRMEQLYQKENVYQANRQVSYDASEAFIKRLSNLPVGAKLEVVDETNPTKTKTREGKYLSLKSGLATSVYFVGRDLENDKLIVENVG